MSSEAINATSAVAQQAQPNLQEQVQNTSQKVSEVRAAERLERVQQADAAKQAQEQPSIEELETAVSQINEMMKEGQRAVAFDLDKDSGQVVVKVTNASTDEIIRQIPNEEALKFAKNLEGMMGMIFNDKA